MNVQRFFFTLPHILQNSLISIFNFLEYRKRYGGKYTFYRKLYFENRNLTLKELEAIQEKRFAEFVLLAKANSSFYKQIFHNVHDLSLNNICNFPILDKETLRANIEKIYTIPEKYAIRSKTGGTTGKSLEVLFSKENMQERFALLDNFRSQFGYKLGKKTAWFSGKSLLTKRDLNKKRFWKDDYYHKVRYYSTFHMKDCFLRYYVEDLIRFSPEYMVGFPSTILQIANYGLKHGYEFPAGVVKAIFPTAETITADMRIPIEEFFKTKMYNQYASSEGAPFIFECRNSKLHLELQSGVFEVVNDEGEPSETGRLVVTSFTTEGTPLIRYDIGDSLTLSSESCTCGNNNPIVKEILGRIDDYVFSPEVGKINLGNLSNTLKNTHGIIKFQVVQDHLDKLLIKLVIDQVVFSKKDMEIFTENWRERVGNSMTLDFEVLQDIPTEASGKYRIVKNNIKHLI